MPIQQQQQQQQHGPGGIMPLFFKYVRRIPFFLPGNPDVQFFFFFFFAFEQKDSVPVEALLNTSMSELHSPPTAILATNSATNTSLTATLVVPALPPGFTHSSTDENLPSLEGTLLKLSEKGLIKIWKKRYFVVRKGKLYYYRKTER